MACLLYTSYKYPNKTVGQLIADRFRISLVGAIGTPVSYTHLDVYKRQVYDRSVVREPAYSTFGEFQLLTREGDLSLIHI